MTSTLIWGTTTDLVRGTVDVHESGTRTRVPIPLLLRFTAINEVIVREAQGSRLEIALLIPI